MRHLIQCPTLLPEHRWVGPVPHSMVRNDLPDTGEEDPFGRESAPEMIPAAWFLRPTPAEGWGDWNPESPPWGRDDSRWGTQRDFDARWQTASSGRPMLLVEEGGVLGWWVQVPIRRSRLADQLVERARAEGVTLRGLRPDEEAGEPWTPEQVREGQIREWLAQEGPRACGYGCGGGASLVEWERRQQRPAEDAPPLDPDRW